MAATPIGQAKLAWESGLSNNTMAQGYIDLLADLKNLGEELGAIYEWAVAQEIWRRICISSADELPEHIHFWQSHG
jgi:hypothetical protein